MTRLLIAAALGCSVFAAATGVGGPLTRPDRYPSWIVIALLPLAAIVLSASLLVVVIAPLLVWGGVILWRSERSRRTREQQIRNLPVVVELLARQTAMGHTVSSALASLHPDQLATAGLTSVARRIDAGQSARSALAEEEGLLAGALLAAELSGADASNTLERLADRLRARASDGAAARAQSGQQIASAAAMALIAPTASILFALADERAARFYLHQPMGALVVGVSLTLSACSFLWMRRLSSPVPSP